MIFFVEGPAAAGKSSFVHALAETDKRFIAVAENTLPVDGVKDAAYFMRNDEHKIDEITRLVTQQPDKHLIVDRGHASVLARTFAEQQNGFCNDFATARAWYESKRDANELVIPDQYIFIEAPLSLIHERARKGGWFRDDLIWVRDPQTAIEYYERFFSEDEPSIPLKKYDGSKETADLISDFLNDFESVL